MLQLKVPVLTHCANLPNGDGSGCKKQADYCAGRADQDEDKVGPDDEFECRTLKILQFDAPAGVVITNCMFEEDAVEVWYYRENGNTPLNIDQVKKDIQDKIELSPGKELTLTEVLGKPIYRETAVHPAKKVECSGSSTSFRTIGAFVKVTGQQNSVHGLLAGHGLDHGDKIMDSNTNEHVGIVTCVCHGTVCSGPGEGSCDAALCTIKCDFRCDVTTYGTRSRCLSSEPQDPVHKNLHVEKFCDDADQHQGRVEYTNYNSLIERGIKKCVAVLPTGDRPEFHGSGESGTLITTVPSENASGNVDVVNPVAILIGREFVEKTDDGRGLVYSIGVPVKRTLHVLNEQPYCQNGTIELVGLHDR